MKPQKKTANNRRAPKTSLVVKKRRALSEKPVDLDTKKEKGPRRPDDFKKEIESESERKKLTQDKKKEKSQKIEPTRSKLVKKIKRKFERKNDRSTQNIDYAKEKVLYHTDQKKFTTSNEIAQEVEQCSPSSHRRFEDAEFMQQQSVIDGVVDQLIHTTNVEEKPSPLPARKRVKEFEKKLAKMNLDLKRNPKTTAAKDPKKNERLTPEKECTSKLSSSGAKKESRIKSKNQTQKDTTLATKKRNIPVIKNVLNKEQELVKAAPVSNRSSPSIKEEIVRDANEAKKKTTLKGKGFQEVVVSENEGDSSKIRRKKKKADDLKRIGDRKSGHKEQSTSVHKIESENDSNKSYEGTEESCSPEEAFLLLPSCIKREIFDGNGVLDESDNDLKNPKNVGREVKKSIRKSKVLSGIDSGKSKSSINDCKNGKLKVTACRFKNATKEENELIKLNLKIETGKEKPESTGNSEDYSDGEFDKCRPGHDSRRSRHAPSEERAMTNRMKLFGFWSGPKRHRVASLNALAKVHCLYENENGGAYLGGFCKPKPESEKCKEGKTMDYRELQVEVDLKKDQQSSVEKHHCEAKRKLRSVPGLRGKHYDVFEASTSSSDEDSRFEQTKGKGRKKKEKQLEKSSISKGRSRDENNDIKLGKPPKADNKSDDKPTSIKKVNQKRRKKCTEPMDLKDMVVSKRMASLNASAILAASYSDEKNRVGTSSDTSSSNDSDLEFLKKRKPSDAETEKKKQRQSGSDADDLSNPSKKVVIVNQDTDVTITGVYVNQTRSTHHEGFCSIAGMQYRISSTSHTQTAATAVSTELHDQKEQPSKSYTPLGALSSMQPPGSQGSHSNMSPRRYSAFSAPHQHGYYQPAGPLIQHPPSLQIKGPPPESTPTPPHITESSEEIIPTSSIHSGNTGGGFYRSYCPQYYATPPQYQELCYAPSYAHSHPHPPPYYKYAPPYRRQYYGYQESPPVEGSGASGTGHGVSDFHSPPGEYLPPYYSGYPPPPPPPPPPPNPAYLHAQGRPFMDHSFQSCPCPMQSCPKNVDTGPLIGNGKGAPVASGPGLSLPPSALVGPPSPARGLAGLAPPHGANAWDTDRVQLNPVYRNHQAQHLRKQQKQQERFMPEHGSAEEDDCSMGTIVQRPELKQPKTELIAFSGNDATNVGEKTRTLPEQLPNLELDNNNIKCEACRGHRCCRKLHDWTTSHSDLNNQPDEDEGNKQFAGSDIPRRRCFHTIRNQPWSGRGYAKSTKGKSEKRIQTSTAEYAVKSELQERRCGCHSESNDCEQCDSQLGPSTEIDKDSGILEDDPVSAKLEVDGDSADFKQGITSAMLSADRSSWASLNYEPAVAAINETHDDEGTVDVMKDTELRESRTISKALEQKQQKLNKRKLSLDIASDSAQPKKVSKRTRSVGPHKENARYSMLSTESLHSQQYQDEITQSQNINKEQDLPGVTERKAKPKCNPSRKRKCDSITSGEHPTKKTKVSNPKVMATEISIMQTIDDVIQQSVEMSPEFVRLEELNERPEEKMQERDKRKNFCQFASTMKSRKKRDTVKNPVSRGLTLIDTKLESKYNKINNRINMKAKSKILVVKKKNLKIKVKSNAMNKNEISESNDGQLPNPEHINDFSNSDPQIPEQTENNKILEPKNSRTSANESNENSRTTSCIPSIDSAKLIKLGNINEFGKSRNIITINGYRSKYKNKKFGNRDLEDFQSKRAVDRDIPWSKNPNPSVTPSLVVSTNVQSLASKNRVFVTESGSEKQQKYLEFNDSGSKSVKRPIIRRGTNWRMGEEFINGSPEKCFSISRRPSLKPRWSNGWSWEGGAFEAKVYLTNEESAIRRCYAKMRHESGDVLQPRDCVLLKSGPRKADLPFVAKIAALWENPEDGEMMFSLLWYYRPEHTEQGRSDKDSDDEVFASRHRDANSVACIEDKCYILTFHEYCRYRKNIRRIEEGLDSPGLIVPPGDQRYPREARIPQTPVPQDMVLFCRRVYDYRGKKLVKNPG